MQELINGATYDRRFVGYPLSVVVSRAPTLVGGVETKFVRPRQPATLGDASTAGAYVGSAGGIEGGSSTW
jgi:hypothetical protein